MTRPDGITEEASKAVSQIFADLRDRRFLKWLFSPYPTLIGRLENEDLRSLDEDVQGEIAEAWEGIIARAILSAEERGAEALRKKALTSGRVEDALTAWWNSNPGPTDTSYREAMVSAITAALSSPQGD